MSSNSAKHVTFYKKTSGTDLGGFFIIFSDQGTWGNFFKNTSYQTTH